MYLDYPRCLRFSELFRLDAWICLTVYPTADSMYSLDFVCCVSYEQQLDALPASIVALP